MRVLVPRAWEGVVSALPAERTVFAVGCAEAPEWAYVEDVYGRQWEEERGERKVGGGGGVKEEEAVWVMREGVSGGMGYLGTERRVRKFIVGEKREGK